jgi:hypothetical protein
VKQAVCPSSRYFQRAGEIVCHEKNLAFHPIGHCIPPLPEPTERAALSVWKVFAFLLRAAHIPLAHRHLLDAVLAEEILQLLLFLRVGRDKVALCYSSPLSFILPVTDLRPTASPDELRTAGDEFFPEERR